MVFRAVYSFSIAISLKNKCSSLTKLPFIQLSSRKIQSLKLALKHSSTCLENPLAIIVYPFDKWPEIKFLLLLNTCKDWDKTESNKQKLMTQFSFWS